MTQWLGKKSHRKVQESVPARMITRIVLNMDQAIDILESQSCAIDRHEEQLSTQFAMLAEILAGKKRH